MTESTIGSVPPSRGVRGALALGLLVGALAGLLNGFLVTKLNLPPFIATLGTLRAVIRPLLLFDQTGTQDEPILALLHRPPRSAATALDEAAAIARLHLTPGGREACRWCRRERSRRRAPGGGSVPG